jgi:hypothetical protein
MTEISTAEPGTAAQARSAVGRLILLVETGDGAEKVSYERRLADAPAARQWCEERLRREIDATVLEIQVTEEVWGHRHAWDATASAHIPETLQLGLRTGPGSISWTPPRVVGSEHGVRRA